MPCKRDGLALRKQRHRAEPQCRHHVVEGAVLQNHPILGHGSSSPTAGGEGRPFRERQPSTTVEGNYPKTRKEGGKGGGQGEGTKGEKELTK